MTEMVEKEDSELTSFHRHTEITTIYRATIFENHLKSSKKDSLQLKILGRNYNDLDRRGGDTPLVVKTHIPE